MNTVLALACFLTLVLPGCRRVDADAVLCPELGFAAPARLAWWVCDGYAPTAKPGSLSCDFERQSAWVCSGDWLGPDPSFAVQARFQVAYPCVVNVSCAPDAQGPPVDWGGPVNGDIPPPAPPAPPDGDRLALAGGVR